MTSTTTTPIRETPLTDIHKSWIAFAIVSAVILSLQTADVRAQTTNAAGWETNAESAAPRNTTTIERAPPITVPQANTAATTSRLTLQALLTADGQRIERDLVWRVFQAPRSSNETPQLVSTKRTSVPALDLPPGRYLINASFGRAHLTKPIEIKSGEVRDETLVLNAGGLRLQTLAAEQPISSKAADYQIFQGERDQSGNRALVMDRAKPGLIVRLNAGIYHIVSRYGDANARVRADITVEAGKLTEATISHAAATVAFKLVDKPGGEALPGTRWTIKTTEGDLVKKSVGALPSHILAPGRYIAIAQSSGQTYEQTFDVTNGQLINVEVLRR
ncbi:MAG: hypothetical protein AAFR75_04795 [Pseudomonadota bacterium]